MAGLIDFEPELSGNGHGMAFSPDLAPAPTPYTNGTCKTPSPYPNPTPAPTAAVAPLSSVASGPAVPPGGDASGLPHVLGLATTNPERILLQKDFPDLFVDVVETSDPRVPDLTKKITKHSGISQRHLAVTPQDYANHPSLIKYGAPSLNDRSKLWEQNGLALGKAAAEKALAEWGGDRQKITHLITFSTSGMLCPGIDLRLIKMLGLSPSVKHFFVSYMGCHAGLIGLRTAAEIAAGDPAHRVLVVCPEVNSVNAQSPDPKNPINNIIVDVIFGDGAAAVIVGAQPQAFETPIFEVHRIATTYIPDSDESITARVTCQGLDVGLARNVPQLVASSVKPFVDSLVGPSLDYEKDILWAVHPGGKAIVDACEKGCNLSPGKLQVSRDILDRFSNMAACTVLFVLDKVRRDNAGTENGNKFTLALAFGPGISVEGSLLRLVS